MKTNLMPAPLTGGAADNLSQEVLDAMERVLSAPEEVRILCAVTFFETVQQVEEKFGRISELSNERRRDLAAYLSAIGLKKFQSNLGTSYGFFLASAHVAASALSGENAVFALSLTTKYLNKLAALAKQADNEGTVAPNAFPGERLFRPLGRPQLGGMLIDPAGQ
jgi:hypothetical protein